MDLEVYCGGSEKGAGSDSVQECLEGGGPDADFDLNKVEVMAC